jgi:hypothetical protein
LVAASVVSANATLTLTLAVNGVTMDTYTDGGTGLIALTGGSLPSNLGKWTLSSQLVGYYSSDFLDLNYQATASSGNTSTLTMTLTETGVGPLPAGGLLSLALGNNGHGGSSAPITENGQINNVTLGSVGPLTGTASGDNTVGVGVYPTTFSLTDQIVLSGKGEDGGDASLTLVPVPEASTMIAGALLILPFGASTLRILRRRYIA